MRRTLAVAAFACYAIHASVHLSRGEPYDLLWGCHIAVILVGVGLLSSQPALNAVGLLWGCFGLPIWVIDNVTGGEFMPSATLTHVGAVAIGLAGVRLLGCPDGVWWKALATYLGLWLVTRVATPAAANINLAFSVWPGWERWFPNYPAYFTTLLVTGALTFFTGELLVRRIPRLEAAAA